MVPRPSSFAAVLAVAALVGCSGAASAPAPAPAPAPSQRPAAGARVLAIADAIVDDLFANSPDYVAMLRPPGARFDDLPDDSLPALAARQAREDGYLAELAGVDRAALGEGPEALAYDIAKETLEARRDVRVCRGELWLPVRQMGGGIQVNLANLAQAQPVGTPEARRAALARFAKLPAFVATHLANLREGLRLGYTQAAINVRQVVAQLDKMTEGPPESSPFYSPAERDADPEFRAQWAALVAREITPAWVKLRDFLRDEYLPKARTAFGVSANPDGAACYKAAIRYSTTLPLEPKVVHERGIAELAHLEAEMKALSAKSFAGADVRALLVHFSTDPAYLQKDAAAVRAQASATIARARAALPQAFGLLPTSDVIVEPIPAYQEKNASAHYLTAALDGSRPATYRIRLYQPEKQSVVLGESTAFHETVPGHHLQLNIANQRADNPRIARFLFNSGFGEGWALYAERLSDELGLYSDDASRFGMLSNAAWRAVRLIVDTGLHAFGWDRERAVLLLLEHTALSRQQAEQEVDRYISWPGQATSYMTGYLEITALRAEAEKAFGPAFDRKAFHDRVLSGGSVPLPVLRRRVEQWIAAGAHGAGGPR
jgi:uncharacterized protein (DUF885 family)